MNGVLHGINPGMSWSIEENEEEMRGELISDGSGSYLLPVLEALWKFL